MTAARCGWFRWDGADLLVYLRVQPRASRDAFAVTGDQQLKVWITAPPVDGKANSHLLRFLAHSFGVNKTSVTLESGQRGKHKRVRIRQPGRFPVAMEGESDHLQERS